MLKNNPSITVYFCSTVLYSDLNIGNADKHYMDGVEFQRVDDS